MTTQRTSSHVLMIRPKRFAFNAETASTNTFQIPPAPDVADTIAVEAQIEFDLAKELLLGAGISVSSFDDPDGDSPDALFPNNWVSFHEDGTVVLYPMMMPSRREEIRPEIIEALAANGTFTYERTLDLTGWVGKEKFLEGTGSLVLDRRNRIAYACLSPRTDRDLIDLWCHELCYNAVVFRATDARKIPIYHTNVMMSVGEKVAVVCAESIDDDSEREVVRGSLIETGHTIVEISREQMEAFAGNVVELRSKDDESILLMSERAHNTFETGQIDLFQKYDRIISIPLDVIELHGGGSIRCMLAEIPDIERRSA